MSAPGRPGAAGRDAHRAAAPVRDHRTARSARWSRTAPASARATNAAATASWSPSRRQDGHPALRLDTKVVRVRPGRPLRRAGRAHPGAGRRRHPDLGRGRAHRDAAPRRPGRRAPSRPPSSAPGGGRTTTATAAQQLTIEQAPAGSTVLSTVVEGRGGRCTAHADLYAAEGGKLTVGPSVVDRAAPGCAPSSTSVLKVWPATARCAASSWATTNSRATYSRAK